MAIPVLSGSAAYALAEFTGLKGTLAEKPKYRPTFYAVIVVATLAGVALNLLRIDVISALFYTAVINGVVAPPLMVLIALLGSDKEVMQKRVSGRVSFVLVWIATSSMTIAALLLIVTLVPNMPAALTHFNGSFRAEPTPAGQERAQLNNKNEIIRRQRPRTITGRRLRPRCLTRSISRGAWSPVRSP